MKKSLARKLSVSALIALTIILGAGMVFVPHPATASAAACTAPLTNYGTVTNNVTVPSTGTYRVWSRVAAADTTNNTYLLEIYNGSTSNCYTVGGSALPVYGTSTTTHFNNDTTNWVSTDLSTNSPIDVSLTAGTTYTLKLIGNGPNVLVDRLILTSDTTCVPSGTGDNCIPPPSVLCIGPPSVPSILPRNEITATSIKSFWNASTPATGCTMKDYLIYRGGKQIATTTNTSYTDTGLQPSTSYTYTIQAEDTSGNKSSMTAPFTYTTNPSTVPSIVLTKPDDGDTVTGDVHINVSLSGNIDHVNYIIDRDFLAQSSGATPNIVWRTTKKDNGSHLIVANAFNSHDQKVGSSQVTITVHNTFCLSPSLTLGVEVCF